MKPVLFGCSGLVLSPEEKAFFQEVQPFGFILFKRNCEHPDQVRQLVADLRSCVNGRVPVFVDQEGGRVARLRPPHWDNLPAMGLWGKLFERDPVKGVEAVRLHAQYTACVLRDLGLDGNCAPVLDLAIDGMSDAIGDRAFSGNPHVVATLGRVCVETYLAFGVMPVIKHFPGHGRVRVDPHEQLPFVDCDLHLLETQDFVPFKAIQDAPVGMNCHVVFRAIDAENPISLSAHAHQEIIRGALGFKGILFSDDIAMGALSGVPVRSAAQTPKDLDLLADVARRVKAAGADIVLYCDGQLPDMRVVADALPEMTAEEVARWEAARARLGRERWSLKQKARAFERLQVLKIEADRAALPRGEADLVIALDGFDGPIDLLLTLAREQKVDLSTLSILALAEQYLAFIANVRQLRLELAADYLVMAAWLAYLKSRLLLPEPPKDEPNPAEMAEALKYQLQRLEAMQRVSGLLQAQPQLGSEVFLRGRPPALEVTEKPQYYLPLYELLSALAAPLRRRKPPTYNIHQTRLFSLEESMGRLRHLLGGPDWGVLMEFLPALEGNDKMEARSAVASTFAASLELVKMGELELRQDGTYAPIYVRRREPIEPTIDSTGHDEPPDLAP